jgi:sugar phosphate isomerase/epimerase
MFDRPIFVSTSCIAAPQLLEGRVSAFLDHGLNHIELGAGVILGHNSLAWIKGQTCQFLVHNYFPPPSEPFVLNLASPNTAIRSRSINFVGETLHLCAQMSIPFYSVHAGFITDPVGFGATGFILPHPDSADAPRQAMARFIDSLTICATEAQRLGLYLLVENNVCPQELRGKLLLQRAEEFAELFRALPAGLPLGILLDTGHLTVSARTFGFEAMDFVHTLAPYVMAFHVHENDGVADTHKPVQPGSWILELLRMKQFERLPVVLEARFDEVCAIVRQVNWLRGEGY